MQGNPVIHVVFGSAAPSMRQAIAHAGWPERVASTHDVFSLGPIVAGPMTPAEMDARVRAVNAILGISKWQTTVKDNALLLAASLAPGVRPVIWFSRRDTQSYAGFLWWLSHRGEGPCEVVDLTETTLPSRGIPGNRLERRLAVSPGWVPPEELIDLRQAARPLSADERRRYRGAWQGLVRENTPLRIIDGGELISVPVSHFDPLLLSCVVDRWRKMARVIGEAMAAGFDDDHHQTGDLFLHARLRALVEAGAIEAVGDVTRMGYCEVRLPSKRRRDG